jgi:hypothetical protein
MVNHQSSFGQYLHLLKVKCENNTMWTWVQYLLFRSVLLTLDDVYSNLIRGWIILAIVEVLYIRSKCSTNQNKHLEKHIPVSEETVSTTSAEQTYLNS